MMLDRKEMNKIIKADFPIERFALLADQAIQFIKEKNERYKVELIKDIPEDEVIVSSHL